MLHWDFSSQINFWFLAVEDVKGEAPILSGFFVVVSR